MLRVDAAIEIELQFRRLVILISGVSNSPEKGFLGPIIFYTKNLIISKTYQIYE